MKVRLNLHKRNVTNDTDVRCIDLTWSKEFLNLNDYCPKSFKDLRYILVVTDKISELCWTVPIKNEIVQRKTHLKTFYKHQKDEHFYLRLMIEKIL